MENILSKLLEADNSVIIQGTNELREAFRSPNAIPALCNVLSTSNSPQIRQYAAVLLKKRLTKQKQWWKLTPDVQNNIKQGILLVLINEKERFVKNSVAQFVAVIAKHELSKSNWPELLKLIQDLVTSSNQCEVELGLFTLSVLTDIALNIFIKNPAPSSAFFSNTFQSPNCLNTTVGYYTIMTMMHVVPMCKNDSDLRNAYRKAIPQVIEIIRHLASVDEEKACECMELFDEISQSAVPLLVPHVQPVICLCLELAKNKNLQDSVRNRALTLIGWITRRKKKVVITQELIKPIVDVIFALMCEPPEDDDDDYFVDDEDDSTPTTNATQTLDVLALHLPPEKLITPVLEHVSAGLAGDNLYVKKASYLALAMLAEGCADCIRTKFLKLFLECVCRGITDSAPVVRNAALFALGQFSEYLQPEISEYANELMPVLFEYLEQLCTKLLTDGKQPPGVDRMFYALEVFCENLEDKLMPYLPVLMERLLMALKREHAVQIQELAMSTIGAAANAVKTGILPFFPRIIEHLKMYLMVEHEPETVCLQVQAIDTLGILARTLGAEHFAPLAQETMQLGLMLSNSDDPDLKKAIYILFASLSTIMKEEMSSYLPRIIEMMVESLKSSDGVMPHYKDDENAAFPIYDEDLSDTPDEEDIENESEASSDSDAVQYTVENAYIEEKESACLALKDIAFNTGTAYLPYLENTFGEMYKLTNHPHDDIRKASIEALAQFCINFSKVESPEGRKALSNALQMVIPKCSELVRMDDERSVVIGALDSFNEMIVEIKRPVLENEGHRAAIINCIKAVLSYQTLCQDKEEDDTECEDAEQDELLMETAGDIIPHLGEAMDSNEFVSCMSELLPIITEKLKKKSSVSQRSFFVGTLAECMPFIGPELAIQAVHMFNIFLPLVKDPNPEVRSNAIYGIGELAFHAKQPIYPHYNQILTALSNVMCRETDNSTIGNVCGTLARLIITNTELVPLDVVFPVFIQRLPLREDIEEHAAVLKCFGHLYQLGHSILLKHLPDVIKICFMIISDSDEKPGDVLKILNAFKDEVLAMAGEFLKTSQKDFPAEFSTVLQSLPVEVSTEVNRVLSSSS